MGIAGANTTFTIATAGDAGSATKVVSAAMLVPLRRTVGSAFPAGFASAPGPARPGVGEPGWASWAVVSAVALTGTAGAAVPPWGPGGTNTVAASDATDCGATALAVTIPGDAEPCDAKPDDAEPAQVGEPAGKAGLRPLARSASKPDHAVSVPWPDTIPWAVAVPWFAGKVVVFAGPAAVLPCTDVGAPSFATIGVAAKVDNTAANPVPVAGVDAELAGAVAIGRS